jgi:hypothetical protein
MEEYIHDIDFINGKRNEGYYTFTNQDGMHEVCIKITKGEESRNYDPIDFLNLVLESYYIQIDKTTKLVDRLTKVYDAKRQVFHSIGEFKRELNRYKDNKKEYDFIDVINEVNSTIDKIRLELELKKYDLEVEKLRIETRWYKEPILLLGAAIAALVGLITLYKGCK